MNNHGFDFECYGKLFFGFEFDLQTSVFSENYVFGIISYISFVILRFSLVLFQYFDFDIDPVFF